MEDLDGRILELLAKGPLTPDEVARLLSTSWATAQGRLLKLNGEGKVKLARKGRVNVYYAASPTSLRFGTPPWVRVRPLDELARELEPYFATRPSAAEIVRRERGRY